MATVDTFGAFLDSQKEKQHPTAYWDAQKVKWIKSVDDLYSKIKGWLAGYMKQGLLDYKEVPVQLEEEHIGAYALTSLQINIGDNIISLIPKGTLILGSYGRLDLQGPKGSVLIVEPEWNDWKIFTRKPRSYTDLNEEAFKEILQEIV